MECGARDEQDGHGTLNIPSSVTSPTIKGGWGRREGGLKEKYVEHLAPGKGQSINTED